MRAVRRRKPFVLRASSGPFSRNGRRERAARREPLGLGADHEIVPSDFTSTPLAISSWERTASVGNMRSMIRRT